MNLKSKFYLWTLALMGLLALFGVASVWQLVSVLRTLRTTSAEYEAMDRADGVGGQVVWLRDVFRGPDASRFRDAKHFAPIEQEVREVVRQLETAARLDDGDRSAELQLAKSVNAHLGEAVRLGTAEPAGAAGSTTSRAAAGELELLRQNLDAVATLMPSAARRHMNSAADRISSRLAWTCIWLFIVLALSTAIHYRQYRALVRPLLWLREDLRTSAAREFKEEVRPRGDREFRDVATYFNGLAKELASLYRTLEEKVIARSRELVRSERLASVGFLAAGVAHEINNPLSVISGYSELAAKSLRRVLEGPGAGSRGFDEDEAQAEAESLSSALEAQDIIREEAFRCKEITSRLLSLARGGGDGRQLLLMDELARQVTVLTKGLRNYKDRRVVLDFKQTGPSMEVIANPTEMKQVFLNLTVNALEAVSGDRGEVRIGGRRNGAWVELFVEDNGKGMSSDTLGQIFEPFYTAKRGSGEPGTGLGLSITHAIVENHGGGIRAESSGPGHGSRFTVRLPARTGVLALD